jgi:hypothetical protein
MRAPWTDRWAGAMTAVAAILALVGVLGSGPASYAALIVAAGITMFIVRGEDAADRTALRHAAEDAPVYGAIMDGERLVGRR